MMGDDLLDPAARRAIKKAALREALVRDRQPRRVPVTSLLRAYPDVALWLAEASEALRELAATRRGGTYHELMSLLDQFLDPAAPVDPRALRRALDALYADTEDRCSVLLDALDAACGEFNDMEPV